jgi:hypothetical protein
MDIAMVKHPRITSTAACWNSTRVTASVTVAQDSTAAVTANAFLRYI